MAGRRCVSDHTRTPPPPPPNKQQSGSASHSMRNTYGPPPCSFRQPATPSACHPRTAHAPTTPPLQPLPPSPPCPSPACASSLRPSSDDTIRRRSADRGPRPLGVPAAAAGRRLAGLFRQHALQAARATTPSSSVASGSFELIFIETAAGESTHHLQRPTQQPACLPPLTSRYGGNGLLF